MSPSSRKPIFTCTWNSGCPFLTAPRILIDLEPVEIPQRLTCLHQRVTDRLMDAFVGHTRGRALQGVRFCRERELETRTEAYCHCRPGRSASRGLTGFWGCLRARGLQKLQLGWEGHVIGRAKEGRWQRRPYERLVTYKEFTSTASQSRTLRILRKDE